MKKTGVIATEIKTESVPEQLSPYRPASFERLPENRSGRFANLLNDAITQTEKKPPAAAPATLGSSAMPRSTRFMDSMTIEQRRSSVEDKDFVPMPAAMERARGIFK
ncbi:hypothetical protein L6205_09380 [Pseudomonas syringae pv. syringae]|nr:hypothetical protein [Pseudomonas syringae]MCH5529362.1 hypothetical protein [Pseudomonas syringae pv. syringae]MCH5539413.1 hypothetical protein [Pseudomonas syringae pv. syringae]MCH5544593.1 hypothetical protein [Pseudomonas syringae pv. syringae]MCH5602731.1 hypothetical protein [Pseudomonas syringae pv. syringae]MCH5607863.1 hypothetical protein [Pseudomonas syringae pv. syringae]